eukprot:04323.XXX_83947_85710_1 [CDS] Oithona nana genome sequencing.
MNNFQILILTLFFSAYMADELPLDPNAAIAFLKAKVEAEGEPKGEAFKTIKGPKCLNSKIGIVGAGPSGVHMAYQLKQKGYTNVTILERSNRVGGKAETFFYREAEMPMAVVLWTADYATTLVPLLEKYGLKEEDDSNVMIPAYQNIYWPTNSDTVPGFLPSSLATPQSFVAIVQALNAYTDLHQGYLGIYGNEYGLMQRPSQETLDMIGDGSIKDFLVANDLLALEPLFRIFFNINGYGTLQEVPVIYGLIWATPLAVFDLFVVGSKALKNKSIGQLFPKMVEDEDLDVVFNFNVVSIKRKCFDRVEVESFDGDIMEFDYLFWSGPPSDFQKVAHFSILPKAHEKIFTSSAYTFAATSIVDARDMTKGFTANTFFSNLNVEKFSNEVVVDLDLEAMAMNMSMSDYVDGNFVYQDDQPPSEKWTFLAFQYGSVYEKKPSLKELKDKLVSHYEAFNAKDIEVLYTKPFDYFPRWGMEEASQGYHWDLLDIQGQHNIAYIGGGCSFEST